MNYLGGNLWVASQVFLLEVYMVFVPFVFWIGYYYTECFYSMVTLSRARGWRWLMNRIQI